ncbi:hypothetical protein [Aestuariicoccus sp. MJ-SS9]|uniref:hypothetical protein n=1 Tax=Aestuariicoccus sp. MJ-SS9 TaxID=3079855 RepID=UPI0029139792|nr:hypothetical protein [Aestuariicoccus sp. MJ-SS9]MDU8912488.1 hypothetical protein [Aestuariicoccus sp. MJ-SS9]
MSEPTENFKKKNITPMASTVRYTVGHLFWGTIIVFAIASLALTVLAVMQPVKDDTGSEELTNNSDPELPTTFLEKILLGASKEALDVVLPDIEKLVEEAYKPVDDAIAPYADFHYSVPGQYIELTQAARGIMADRIHDRLFDGLSERLNDVASNVDEKFETAFEAALDAQIAELFEADQEGLPIGPLSDMVITDTRERLMLTAPIATTAVAVTAGASLKIASKTIASKLGLKVAAKVAAKQATKGGGALVGAGSGAALCSWAGPGAAVCAVVGAAAVWFTVDAAAIQLDEQMTRDEFEKDLNELVDDDKDFRTQKLKEALKKRAVAMDEGAKKALAEFTLKQLSDPETVALCQQSNALLTGYGVFQDDLRTRTSSAIEEYRRTLEELRNRKDSAATILAPLVMEIDKNLEMHGYGIEIKQIQLSGNFPSDYLGYRDLDGRLTLGDQTVTLERNTSTVEVEFSLQSPTNLKNLKINRKEPITIHMALIQDRRIFRDRMFGRSILIKEDEFFDAIPNTAGPQKTLNFPFNLALYESRDDFQVIDWRETSARRNANLRLDISGSSLPDIEKIPSCFED